MRSPLLLQTAQAFVVLILGMLPLLVLIWKRGILTRLQNWLKSIADMFIFCKVNANAALDQGGEIAQRVKFSPLPLIDIGTGGKRLPSWSSSGEFKSGEFTKLFQDVLDTIDLIFRNGVDCKALRAAFKTVQIENEGTDLAI